MLMSWTLSPTSPTVLQYSMERAMPTSAPPRPGWASGWRTEPPSQHGRTSSCDPPPPE